MRRVRVRGLPSTLAIWPGRDPVITRWRDGAIQCDERSRSAFLGSPAGALVGAVSVSRRAPRA